MAITPLPQAPSRNDSPADFASDADAFVAALDQFVTETNSAITTINAQSSQTAIDSAAAVAAANSAQSDAQTAEDSAAAALVSETNAANSADAAETFATESGQVFIANSITSNSVGTGTKSFTLSNSNPRAFGIGTPVRISDSSSPATNYMDGIVTAYSHPSLTISVSSSNGSGTFTAWTISVFGSTPSSQQPWQTKTGNYTASIGDRLRFDLSGGAATLTLPTSGLIDDASITFADDYGNFDTNNLTINGNGNDINGQSTVEINVNWFSAVLRWNSNVGEWRIICC